MADRIRSALYSNIRVYEMVVRGTAVMIRKSDGFVNATQILRAAGLPKPARTKVLEKEVSRGVHEKVQGGYAGSQGTWIPLYSAIALAQQYHVYEECSPLFHYDMSSGQAEATSPPAKAKRVVKPFSDASSSDEREKKRTVSGSGYVNATISADASPEIPPKRESRVRASRKNLTEDYDETMDEDDDEFSFITERSKKSTRKDEISHSRQDSNFSHPDAGKICQNCGVTETPQWRRGPGGKRTLCNACGVKWSSGRLHLPANLGSVFGFSVSESENNHSSEPHSSFEDVEVGSSAWKVQLEVSRLKSKLRETERGQKKLSRLLADARAVDREIDRCYRRLLSGAKKTLPKKYSPKYGNLINNLFHKYEDEIEEDLNDPDLGVVYGDSTDHDKFVERQLVARFIHSSKRLWQ